MKTAARRARIRQIQETLGTSSPWWFAVAALGVSAGFLQAGLIVTLLSVVANLRTAGPIDVPAIASGASLEQVLGVAAGILVLLLVVEVANARLVSAMLFRAISTQRRAIARQFLASDVGAQVGRRDGAMQEFLTTYVNSAVQTVDIGSRAITAAGNFLILFLAAVVLDPRSAAVMVVSLSVLMLAIRPITRAVRRRSTEVADVNKLYAEDVTDMSTIAAEIRTFGVSDTWERKLGERIDELERPYRSSRFLVRINGPITRNLALLVVVGLLLAADSSGVGLESLSMVGLLVRSVTYAQGLAQTRNQFDSVVPYLDQLIALRDDLSSEATVPGVAVLGPIDTIDLRGVVVAYSPGEPVLRGVDLQIGAKECIGIIGASGGGKSTLLKILLRLRHADQGTVEVNGMPAETFDMASWSRQVAFVPQEPRMIEGTVAENITFGRTGISRAAVEDAATRAGIAEEIDQWPLGYETPVAARGTTLSGGQRQRICLARALAGMPSLLVLDEPTSSLDEAAEQKILETMYQARGELAMVVVSHRPAVLAHCDRLLQLSDGRLSEKAATEVSLT